jgi:hypothetical protein
MDKTMADAAPQPQFDALAMFKASVAAKMLKALS